MPCDDGSRARRSATVIPAGHLRQLNSNVGAQNVCALPGWCHRWGRSANATTVNAVIEPFWAPMQAELLTRER